MSKIGTVFRFEVMRQLKKPSFWISLLLFPLGIVGIVGLSSIGNYGTDEAIRKGSDLTDRKLGLTDQSHIFYSVNPEEDAYDFSDSFNLKFTKIATPEDGIAKIKTGELDVYYHIPADFFETKTIKVYDRAKDAGLISNFGVPMSNLLKSIALAKVEPKDLLFITGTVQYDQTNFDTNGQPTNLLGQAIVPIAVLVIFYILICVFGNRLTMALVEEKENRISEMILTAVPAKQLVIGKILSLIVLGFVQVAVFVIPLIAILIIYRNNPMVADVLSIIEINPLTTVVNLLLLLVSYFFFAGACTLVGSLVPTAREASQYIAPVMFSIVLPFFFMGSFFAETPNLTVYILTYFPLSAPVALMLRNAIGSLPFYELVLGVIEIAICSAVILSLTIKSFQKNAINFSVVRPSFKPRKAWKR